MPVVVNGGRVQAVHANVGKLSYSCVPCDESALTTT